MSRYSARYAPDAGPDLAFLSAAANLAFDESALGAFFGGVVTTANGFALRLLAGDAPPSEVPISGALPLMESALAGLGLLHKRRRGG